MSDDDQLTPGQRVAAAMKVSNLLRSADDRALLRFAKSQVQSDAVKARSLRTLRTLAERVAWLLDHADAADLERAERALEALDEIEAPASSERPTVPPVQPSIVGPDAPSLQAAPALGAPPVATAASPSPWTQPASALGTRPAYPRSGAHDEPTLTQARPAYVDVAPEPPTWREPPLDPDGGTFSEADAHAQPALPFSGRPGAVPPPAVPNMRISPDGGTIQSDVAPQGPALPFAPAGEGHEE